MNIKQLATDVLELTGTSSNIINVIHCATRLRFTLHDTSRVKAKDIEALDGVITTVNSAGQFQVVIGNRVSEVYNELITLLGDKKVTQQDGQQDKKKSIVSHFIDVVSSVFTPLLGAMVAAGMLKGLLAIAVSVGWLSKTDSSWHILWAASDGLFLFLPILLASAAAKKFNCNMYVAMSVAAALVYPDLISLANPGDIVYFFGIPVVMMKYTSSVIPIIISIWVMSLLEHRLNKFFHETIRNILTPFILLSVMVPLTLATIGPVSVVASNMLATLFVTIYHYNPIISGGLFAASWQVFVIFGVHWGFTAVFINDIAMTGRSYLKAGAGPAVFAQAGAILAVMLRTRDAKMKALSGPALISALFGITEPGIYGITLKLKRPFICAIVAAGIGGMVVGWAHSSALSMGITGLLTLPLFYGPGFGGFVAGCFISFVLAVIFTWFFGIKEEPVTGELDSSGTNGKKTFDNIDETSLISDESIMVLTMPIKGSVVPLENVNDRVFSSGVVGKGCAIIPDIGELYAPVSGYIGGVFETGHAITIQADNGAEILIHIGIDTVTLGGKYFEKIVKDGDRIEQGDLLLRFDIDGIKSSGLDITTPIIITNSEDFSMMTVVADNKITNVGDVMITLNK